MSGYLALARKHRPQTFEDIVGQEHVCKTLQKAIEGQRIHHAYLFAGIRGIGKTTCARVLAKALNCKDGPTPHPCNTCVSCVEITAGRSMDVMELDAASNRGIDDIRELREGVRYTTARDRFKVVIIDEVHMLTEQAFNALLKTLEEPPAHVRFILATTDPQKLPATILSRCQRFDFRRVSTAALVAHLARICTKESVEVEEDALAIVVRQTQGSVRDSMSLLDQLIAAAEGKVTAQFAKEVLGVADRRWVLDCLSALLGGDARKALLVLREVFVSGYDVFLFISEVLQNLRNAMVLAVTGKNKELVDLSQSELNELVEIIKGRNPLDLHYYLQVMLQAVEQIRRSEFPLFAAEEALVRVASASQTAQVSHLVQRLVDLEQKIAKAVSEPDLFRGGSTPAGQRSADLPNDPPAVAPASAAPVPASPLPAPPAPLPAHTSSQRAPSARSTAQPVEPASRDIIAPLPGGEPSAVVEPDTKPIDEPAALVEPDTKPIDEPPPMLEPDTKPIDEPAALVEPDTMPIDEPAALVEPDTKPIDEPPAMLEPERVPQTAPAPVPACGENPAELPAADSDNEAANSAAEEDSEESEEAESAEPMKIVQLELETPEGPATATPGGSDEVAGEQPAHFEHEEHEALSAAAPEPPPPTRPVETAALPTSAAEMSKFWEGFVEYVKEQRKNARLGQFEAGALEMLVLKSVEESARRLVVKCPAGTRPLAVSMGLDTILLKYLGFAVKVDFIETDEDNAESIASTRKRQRKDQKARREKELRETRAVQDAVEILRGTISNVKVQEPD